MYLPVAWASVPSKKRKIKEGLDNIAGNDEDSDYFNWLNTQSREGPSQPKFLTISWQWLDFPKHHLHWNKIQCCIKKTKITVEEWLYDYLATKTPNNYWIPLLFPDKNTQNANSTLELSVGPNETLRIINTLERDFENTDRKEHSFKHLDYSADLSEQSYTFYKIGLKSSEGWLLQPTDILYDLIKDRHEEMTIVNLGEGETWGMLSTEDVTRVGKRTRALSLLPPSYSESVINRTASNRIKSMKSPTPTSFVDRDKKVKKSKDSDQVTNEQQQNQILKREKKSKRKEEKESKDNSKGTLQNKNGQKEEEAEVTKQADDDEVRSEEDKTNLMDYTSDAEKKEEGEEMVEEVQNAIASDKVKSPRLSSVSSNSSSSSSVSSSSSSSSSLSSSSSSSSSDKAKEESTNSEAGKTDDTSDNDGSQEKKPTGVVIEMPNSLAEEIKHKGKVLPKATNSERMVANTNGDEKDEVRSVSSSSSTSSSSSSSNNSSVSSSSSASSSSISSSGESRGLVNIKTDTEWNSANRVSNTKTPGPRRRRYAPLLDPTKKIVIKAINRRLSYN
jgi:hypothetical protein